MSLTALQASLNTVPFLATLGVRVEEAEPGRVALRLPLAPGNTNHGGAIHAGALFTVAETAAAVALATHPELADLRHLQVGSSVTWVHTARADATAFAHVPPEQAAAVRRAVARGDEARAEVVVRIRDARGHDVAELRSGFRFKPAR